ncbi:ligand-binding protein SH3 [Clostridium sp. MF28]|uniref:CHAP domain-containing protein n=1 Tax=Clostridium TaxID=1485 RepID=UPI0003014CB2|nr:MULTISPECIES: CHAP domain-containing protein [Clostridium]AVK48862.1 ligand-binding protein SH3 [Clostridium sp. MF28]PSM56549.1 CHAP domain-containing protein [Clostridium diolis]
MNKEFLKKIIITGMTTLMVTNMCYISASAKWINDKNNGWSWLDGDIKTTGWKEIDEKWYYFNTDGIMKTGWLSDNGKWYNLSNSGEMTIGWKKVGEKWYHFNNDGVMSIGWVNDNGTWYYTNFSGEMETGTLGISGKVYTFSDSGEMLNGNTEQIESGSENVNGVKDDTNSRIAYVATNNDSLNVRSDASTSSDIIDNIYRGAQVKIVDDEKNGFYPIIINGKRGWVSSKWVTFNKPEDETTKSPISSNIPNSSVDTPSVDNKNSNAISGSLSDIRNTQPSTDNKYYYSDDNLFYKVKLSPPFYSGGKPIKGNCTWYAWGRAWEITGVKPSDAGFIGNAYEWWDANQKSGKYQYGSQPRVGAIAVWKSNMPNSGGDGHVAIVEKIDGGKIYISESTWNGVTFRYREIYDTNYLYGYIYLDKANH